MAHSKHIKGDRAELIAAEYFINIGYSVCRNMSQHGPVDLVLIDEDGTGDVILVDVKAISLRTKNGYKVNRVPTKKQQELGVQLIFVNLDTKEVLDIMPTKTKEPEVDLTNVVPFEEEMSTEKHYYLKDGMLCRDTENDGWTYLKHGAEPTTKVLMTEEEAKRSIYADKLKQIYKRQIAEIEAMEEENNV